MNSCVDHMAEESESRSAFGKILARQSYLFDKVYKPLRSEFSIKYRSYRFHELLIHSGFIKTNPFIDVKVEVNPEIIEWAKKHGKKEAYLLNNRIYFSYSRPNETASAQYTANWNYLNSL